MWVTGEHCEAISKRFGVHHEKIERIANGRIKKPNLMMDFLRTLQRLEIQFAKDLEDMDKGYIDIVYFKSDPQRGEQWIRHDYRSKRKGDKQALAALGVSREGLPGIAPKKNVVPPYYGTGGLGYIKDKPGRSAPGASELRHADRGI